MFIVIIPAATRIPPVMVERVVLEVTSTAYGTPAGTAAEGGSTTKVPQGYAEISRVTRGHGQIRPGGSQQLGLTCAEGRHLALHTIMNSRVIKGAVLAVFGALTIAFGHMFGLDLDQVALLGVTLGAIIGLVPDRSLVERLLGFAAGFVIAYVGYALRAGVLPDTDTAQAVAVFGVI